MATRFRAGQRLKPHSFCILYGTAEAVPYKDLAVATQALKPVLLCRLTCFRLRKLLFERLQRPPQAFFQINFWFPAQQAPRLGNVRAALWGVKGGRGRNDRRHTGGRQCNRRCAVAVRSEASGYAGAAGICLAFDSFMNFALGQEKKCRASVSFLGFRSICISTTTRLPIFMPGMQRAKRFWRDDSLRIYRRRSSPASAQSCNRMGGPASSGVDRATGIVRGAGFRICDRRTLGVTEHERFIELEFAR